MSVHTPKAALVREAQQRGFERVECIHDDPTHVVLEYRPQGGSMARGRPAFALHLCPRPGRSPQVYGVAFGGSESPDVNWQGWLPSLTDALKFVREHGRTTA